MESRIELLVHDLLNYDNEDSQSRLSFDPSARCFLSRAYFTPKEIELLGSVKMDNGSGQTLQEALEEVMERKKAKGDLELCTSHDIAPVLQQAFGIHKDFQKRSEFKRNLKIFNKKWSKTKNLFNID